MARVSVGRLVHYVLSATDAAAIDKRRAPGAGHSFSWPSGAQAHVGNAWSEGAHVPMVVVVVWPNEHGPGQDGVNGQAFLDGNDSLWVTSAREDPGGAPGTWHWPERVE